MVVMRRCNTITLLLLVVLILIGGYGYLTLQESYVHVEQKNHEIVRRQNHEKVLKEQLKVVYHHSKRVEEELTKERNKHKNTLEDLLEKRKQFYSNITKTKHEAWTRFNALDSDYKMLKAEHEEMKTSYLGLQAQYRRLSSDHVRLSKEARSSYEELKKSKDAESMNLQDRVQELYKKNIYYGNLAQQNEDYYKKVKDHFNSCNKLSEEYKNRLTTYYEKLKELREKGNEEAKLNINHTELDSKLSDIREKQRQIVDKKSHQQENLKNITGVNESDLETTMSPTGNNGDDKSLKNNAPDKPKKNFILEQKDRFLKEHRQKSTVPSSPDVENNRYNVLKTTTLAENKFLKDGDDLLNVDRNEVKGDPLENIKSTPELTTVTLRENGDGVKQDTFKGKAVEEQKIINRIVKPIAGYNKENSNVVGEEKKGDGRNAPMAKPVKQPAVDSDNNRLDVKKVNFEEDEKGDQNLDSNEDMMGGRQIEPKDQQNANNGDGWQDTEEGLQEQGLDPNEN